MTKEDAKILVKYSDGSGCMPELIPFWNKFVEETENGHKLYVINKEWINSVFEDAYDLAMKLANGYVDADDIRCGYVYIDSAGRIRGTVSTKYVMQDFWEEFQEWFEKQ